MENNKRRLLKDLPFEGATKNTVIFKGGRGHGGNYSVSRGETYYQTGGSSDRGLTCFTETEESILDVIWDNSEWFENADLNHIDFIPVEEGILLRFKNIDRDEKEDLIKGLIFILPFLQEGKTKNSGYIWNKFKNITTGISNF